MKFFLKIFFSLLSFFCFFHFALVLSDWFHVNDLKEKQVLEKKALSLDLWQVKHWFFCSEAALTSALYLHDFSNCEVRSGESHISFPFRKGVPQDANGVLLRPEIPVDSFLRDRFHLRLGFSRFFHQQSSWKLFEVIQTFPGPLSDEVVTFPRGVSDLNHFDLFLFFGNRERFGPLDVAPTLGEEPFVTESLSFPTRLFAGASLALVFELGLALIINLLAWILNTNPLLFFLGIVGSFRALRQYLAYAFSSGYLIWEGDHLYFWGALNLIVFFVQSFLLIPFTRNLSFLRVFWGAFCFGSLGIFWGSCFHWHKQTFDLLADGLSSSFSLCLLCLLWLKKDVFLKGFVSGLLFLAFTLSLAVNGMDFYHFWLGASKEPLNWLHVSYLPLLFLSSLVKTGSLENLMNRVKLQLENWIAFEKDIKEAKLFHEKALPHLRGHQFDCSWRIGFFPSRPLGGDWCDLQCLETAYGKKLCASCLIDITGHGLGAALLAAVMKSQWSLWLSKLKQGPFPVEEAEWKGLLKAFLKQSDEVFALSSHRDTCTGVFSLYDVEKRELILFSVAHPPVILVEQDQGRRIYFDSNPQPIGSGFFQKEFDVIFFKETLSNETTVFLLSDGVISFEKSVSRWYKSLDRILEHRFEVFEKFFYDSVRRNKRELMLLGKESDIDDATILRLSLGSPL